MIKKLACFILLFLYFSLSSIVYAANNVPTPVIETTNSVVRILVKYSDGYGTGTGFVIKSNEETTLIATNYHVVEGDPHSISVWIDEEETISATILAYTNQKDLCILELAYPVSLQALPLATEEVNQGDAVYAVGFPAAADVLSDKEAHISADATVTDGIISAIRETTVSKYGAPVSIFQITAAINPGNSGGPLFNANGEVIGINTYGIAGAQGIFGAINIAELNGFLSDNSITIGNTEAFHKTLYLLITSVIVAALLVFIVIVVTQKKKANTPPPVSQESITLREYISSHPNGIPIQNAVAMLLPMALNLRDLHNDGNSHLQISPDTIRIGSSGATLVPATVSEGARYTNGFAAPEIYKGISSGNLSDIYSFAAVLYYVLTGKQPCNALSRPENSNIIPDDEASQFDVAIMELINHGLSIAPEARFASMQEVILKMSPYNVAPFVNDMSTTTLPVEALPRATKKIKSRSVIISAIGVLVAVFLVTYLGCYLAARSIVQTGNFKTADRLLFAAPITRLHDAKLVDYIDAGQMMEARNYSEAKKIIESIPNYLNASEFAKEIDYRHAAQYADANDFKKAIEIYRSLRHLNYKDAEQKLLETQFRYGSFLAYEEAKYIEAHQIFTAIRWYSADAKEAIPTLTELIYLEGQLLYSKGKYSEARDYFECVSEYSDSEKYIRLITAHENSWSSVPWLTPEGVAKYLINNFYFEDASNVLLSNQALAENFLRGKWKGNGYYFIMKSDGKISYNLPQFDYGNCNKISDGFLLLYPEGKEYSTKKLFSFKAITPNCIKVFCYKNSKTYTLYRQ